MGKPLGLGAVRLEVLRVDCFEPVLRYSREYVQNESDVRYPFRLTENEIAEMLLEASQNAPPEVLRALIKAGTRAGRRSSYPLAEGVIDQSQQAEQELYLWFVNNEKLEHPNVLPPLADGEYEHLPTTPKA